MPKNRSIIQLIFRTIIRLNSMQKGHHIDSWYAASVNKDLNFPRLEGEIEADICIVGGGYTGLSSAIHLRDKGYSVAVIEAERVGWGASGRNGGH